MPLIRSADFCARSKLLITLHYTWVANEAVFSCHVHDLIGVVSYKDTNKWILLNMKHTGVFLKDLSEPFSNWLLWLI